MNKVLYILFLFLFISIAVVAVIQFSTESLPGTIKDNINKDFAVLEHNATANTYRYLTINGKVKNNSGEDKSYVQIEINLYDKEGSLKGSTMANVGNFEAGATWSFEAMTMKKGIASYEIVEIIGD